MAFKGWDPIRDLVAIRHARDRFAPGSAGWVPAVDIHETADAFVITAELPGLRREDLRIHLESGWLTLEGVRRDPVGPCEQYHRVERGHGAFRRSFQLPAPVDAETILANLQDGVLVVSCPKSREVTPRRVRVT